jgi:Holliday junction resolvase
MSQPEGRLAREVINLIKQRGGYAWKQHGNEFMPAGMPDVIGCYRGLFIGVETKTPEGGEPSARQVYVAGQIRKAQGNVLSPCRDVREVVRFLNRLDALIAGRTAR